MKSFNAFAQHAFIAQAFGHSVLAPAPLPPSPSFPAPAPGPFSFDAFAAQAIRRDERGSSQPRPIGQWVRLPRNAEVWVRVPRD
jgi:hypothetical protein